MPQPAAKQTLEPRIHKPRGDRPSFSPSFALDVLYNLLKPKVFRRAIRLNCGQHFGQIFRANKKPAHGLAFFKVSFDMFGDDFTENREPVQTRLRSEERRVGKEG